MLPIILNACVLVTITVAMHAIGLATVLRALMKSQAALTTSFWPISWLLIRLAWFLISFHLAEISVWGLFYFWKGCLPDVEAAFYFSGVTYTTVGYGDLVLPKPWRIFAPLEALTGILMCGVSTGLFFALVSRWLSNWMQWRSALEPQAAPPSKTKP
jgi:hypothetical protein